MSRLIDTKRALWAAGFAYERNSIGGYDVWGKGTHLIAAYDRSSRSWYAFITDGRDQIGDAAYDTNIVDAVCAAYWLRERE